MKLPGPIRSIMALDSGDSDVYGWSQSHMFAIAETLYGAGETIPESWQFACPWPSGIESWQWRLGESWPDSEYMEAYQAHEINADQLRQAGEIMRRYIRIVRRAGKDY